MVLVTVQNLTEIAYEMRLRSRTGTEEPLQHFSPLTLLFGCIIRLPVYFRKH